MAGRRLKLRKNTGEMREEFEYGQCDDLGEWIDSRIPDAPSGLLCEAEECVQLENYDSPREHKRPLAESYIYTVKEGHVCYTYVCWECSETGVNYLEPVDVENYPTTDSGYAIAPQHCS